MEGKFAGEIRSLSCQASGRDNHGSVAGDCWRKSAREAIMQLSAQLVMALSITVVMVDRKPGLKVGPDLVRGGLIFCQATPQIPVLGGTKHQT